MDFLRVRVLQALIPVSTFARHGAARRDHRVGLEPGDRPGGRQHRRDPGRDPDLAVPAAHADPRPRHAAALPGLLLADLRRRPARCWWSSRARCWRSTLEGGLAAAGYITVAWTLTRYADRADQIIATTIYPAIVVVKDQTATLREIFVKSNRGALMWVLPFCAALVLFAPDLVEFVLGDKWEPAVVLIQGLAGAAAIQQLGYNWFSFYRARGDPRPQAVESVAMVAALPRRSPSRGSSSGASRASSGAGSRRRARRRGARGLRRGCCRDVSLLALAARGAAPVLAAMRGWSLLVRLARGDGRDDRRRRSPRSRCSSASRRSRPGWPSARLLARWSRRRAAAAACARVAAG